MDGWPTTPALIEQTSMDLLTKAACTRQALKAKNLLAAVAVVVVQVGSACDKARFVASLAVWSHSIGVFTLPQTIVLSDQRIPVSHLLSQVHTPPPQTDRQTVRLGSS